MPGTPAVKPRLRGVTHLSMFPAAVALAIPLAFVGESTAAHVSAVVFSVGVAAMFGASGLYHVPTWRPNVRAALCRLDHAAVYGLIAATYTPFGLLALHGAWRIVVLAIVWGGCFAAVVAKVAWVRSPKWLSATIGIALGWVGIVAAPELTREVGVGALLLTAAGGLLYTGGAIVYALRRPNPVPGVFGYHEVFHALVIGAVGLQYAAVAFFVLPGR
jgi:hemolysin III